MSKRTTEPPVTDEDGYEKHPAFGLIGANRYQVGGAGGGSILFDSDVRHGHTVGIKVYAAQRRRDLHRDWIGTDNRMPIVEVEMSEAQWASFVSSMGHGDGVPCTIRTAHEDHLIPGLTPEQRLQESMDEVRGAADKMMAEIQEAFAAFKEKRSAANLKTLESKINNAAPNVAFTAKSLTEHAENVVQRARFDIEAMAVAAAEHRDLEAGSVQVPELEGGSDG